MGTNVLMTSNFYTLSEPPAVKAVLAEYMEYNDPVRQFLDEVLPLLVWDLLPFSFLYDLFKAWYRKNFPSGTVEGKQTFINNLLSALESYPDWYYRGKKVSIRPGDKMDATEPLILEYDLEDWMNPGYNGRDIEKIAHPLLKDNYRGILRVGTTAENAPDDCVSIPL